MSKLNIVRLLVTSAIAMAALTNPASAEFTPAGGPVALLDGDTIVVGKEHIRLLSIDTPELFRPRCENELVLALKAKERLRELLDSGPVTIERDGHDGFRRTLANVKAGDIDVGAVLIEEGFALPYQRGGAAKLARLKVWCGQDAVLPR